MHHSIFPRDSKHTYLHRIAYCGDRQRVFESRGDIIHTINNKMKTIAIKWSTEDVLWQADNLDIELTEEQAEDILESLAENHDATIGINWDVISFYIENYLHNQ